MQKVLSLGLLVLSAILVEAAASSSSLDGLHALVQRRLPDHASSFTFQLVGGEVDSFVVSDTEGKLGGITVECTTVSACGRGLYT